MATTSRKGTKRRWILIVGLVLAVVVSFGALAAHEWLQSQARERLALVADQKLLSQRVATAALEAIAGNAVGFDDLERLSLDFDASLAQVRDGGAGLQRIPPAHLADLDTVVSLWGDTRADIQRVLAGRNAVDDIRERSAAIRATSPELSRLSDEVVRRMALIGAPNDQVYIASRQLMLIQRIEFSLVEVLSGGALAATAIDRFRRDTVLFGRVLDGLREGFAPLNVQKVEDAETQQLLSEVATLFVAFAQSVEGVLELSTQVFAINDAGRSIEQRSAPLFGAIVKLEEGLLKALAQLRMLLLVAFFAAAIALVLLVTIGVQAYRETRRSLDETERQNDRNQQAILRLLDEVMNLAEGDLTVNATVSEDFTGAIADSLNYAIASLRDLVATINGVADELGSVARRSQREILALSVRSEKQAQSILQANTSIGQVSDTAERVASDATESAQVARRSVDTAAKGAKTVRSTIDGMNTIREQIQETAKRIKRLGESSQEIGDIIGLINDVAEQTNVLALNAAIQASAAGEAGRGFAVVADEVQRLAERSAAATRQVESLVKAIQADTSEAIHSMERSTSNVVAGAEQAQAAGEALQEIETESRGLAERVDRIATQASSQAKLAREVSGAMEVIRAITLETTRATRTSAQTIGDLVQLSRDLNQSVSGFRLPDDANRLAAGDVSTVDSDHPEKPVARGL